MGEKALKGRVQDFVRINNPIAEINAFCMRCERMKWHRLIGLNKQLSFIASCSMCSSRVALHKSGPSSIEVSFPKIQRIKFADCREDFWKVVAAIKKTYTREKKLRSKSPRLKKVRAE